MVEFASPKGGIDPIVRDVQEIIRHATSLHGRSRQKTPGPSELGNTCNRALAYKSRGTGSVTAISDPWIATVGTAIHAWLEWAIIEWNKHIGHNRYLTEKRVKVWLPDATEVGGTADCYDTERNLVIDWKSAGADALKKYRSEPSEKYRKQIQLYGMGYQNAGYEVEQVCLVAVPRSGFLRDIVCYREPYDPKVALDTLTRYQEIAKLPEQLAVSEDESRWAWIPTGPDPECHFCNYYRPGEPISSTGCPGPVKLT